MISLMRYYQWDISSVKRKVYTYGLPCKSQLYNIIFNPRVKGTLTVSQFY